MNRLAGKTAVVLGASGSGSMGPAIARRLAAEGAHVVVAARRREPLEALAREIGGAATVCDITDPAQLASLARCATDRYGGINIAVNAAAQGHLAPLAETAESDFDRMVAVNYRGAFLFLQAMIRAMRVRGGGSIVMISTASVRATFESHSAYAAAKAGMEHLVQAAAFEYGRDGIRANVIAPGLTATEMSAGFVSTPGVVAAFTREMPLGRLGTSDDVASAAAWLASDECFMTGAVLEVNGGLALRRNPTMLEIQAAIAAAAPSPGPK